MAGMRGTERLASPARGSRNPRPLGSPSSNSGRGEERDAREPRRIPPRLRYSVTMNGPLLISLLPPERMLESTGAIPGYAPFIAVLLLIGFLLSLFLRHPGR